MLIKIYQTTKRIIVLSTIIFFCLFYSELISQIRDWDQMYPIIDGPVCDMKFSELSGISEYGLLFALPGVGGGLAYFTYPDSLNIFSIATNIGAVSIVPDNPNDRIFCAFGCGSNSDGLYEFDVTTQEFELVTYCEYPPHFVKKVSSGFYFGYGAWNMYGGLLHSTNGDIWTAIDLFNFKDVTDVEENGDGTLFVSAGYEIYIENDGIFNSFNVGLSINDIYVRNYPNNDEVYLACGDGGYYNLVYRVEYENGEITGLTSINGFYYPNRIYEFGGYLVVGCKDGGGLYLVEPEENGQVQQIGAGLGINEVYCFEFYPTYEHNFMVGTDIGVFLATNLTSVSNNELTGINSVILLRNYPNPFKPSTTIYFEATSLHQGYAGQANLHENLRIEIFNIKGQKVNELPIVTPSPGHTFSVTWDGRDSNSKRVGSGIYFYQLNIDNTPIMMKKMILLK